MSAPTDQPTRSTWAEDLELLRDRPVATLLGARVLASLGSSFAPVALAFGVLHLPGATAETLSIVLAAESIPLVVFMLAGGVVADRLPRGRVMIAGEVLSFVAFAAIAVMLGTERAPLAGLCAAAVFSGIGMALFFPALSGVVPEVVPADRLQTGNALLSMGANVARIAGIVAAGLVVALVGAPWALAACAALFLLAAVLTARLPGDRRPARDAEAPATSPLRDLADGWQEFRSREWLWVVVLQFAFLVMFFNAAHGVFGPVIADQELGGAKVWSVVLAGESVGMVVGVAVAMRVRPRHPIRAAVLATIPTVPVPYVLLAVGAPVWTVVVGMFLSGAAFDFFGVLWNTTMQREVPPEALSRVSSYDALGSLMFGPIGLLLAGPAVARFGVHRSLLVSGVALLGICASALLSRGVRETSWHDTPGAAGQVDDAALAPTPAVAP